LIGAMVGRGVQKDFADYYDQAVAKGNILVAVEDHSGGHDESMRRAERIFAAAGALPTARSGSATPTSDRC
jgi:hypothetical protein